MRFFISDRELNEIAQEARILGKAEAIDDILRVLPHGPAFADENSKVFNDTWYFTLNGKECPITWEMRTHGKSAEIAANLRHVYGT